MAATSNIVTVNITIQDAAASVSDFGAICILAKSPFLTAKTYDATPDGLAAMLTDGFTIGSAAYVLGSLLTAQDPGVDSFSVFPRAAQNVQVYTVTPTVLTVGYVYSGIVVGTGGVAVPFEYTVVFGDDATEIATAIRTDITSVTGLAPSVGIGTLILTATTPGDRFYIRDFDPALTIVDASADAGIATDLAAMQVALPDTYGVVLDSNSPAEIAAASAWCETNKKILAAWAIDTDIATSSTTDLASDLAATNPHYTALGVTRDGLYPPIVALMGRQFSRTPGSSVWANKAVALSMVDDWSATALGYLRAKKTIAYVDILGLPMTLDGFAVSGRFLDLTRNVDYIKSLLAANLVTMFANNEVVPYTSVGLGLAESTIGAVLSNVTDLGILASDWTVTMPKITAVPALDKTNRQLKNVKWHGTAQGAVQSIEVDGTITL